MKTDFQVTMNMEGWQGSEKTRPHTLNVSYNGHQWTTISFSSLEDLRKTRNTIDEYIKTYENP